MTTYANWVSKTGEPVRRRARARRGRHRAARPAGPLAGAGVPRRGLELGAGRHRPIPTCEHDLVVCGPDTVGRHDGARSSPARCCPSRCGSHEPLPAGVLDYGVLWPGQSDVFVPPGPTHARHGRVVSTPGGTRTQASLLEAAAAAGHEPGVRLLTDVHPAATKGSRLPRPAGQRGLAGAAARPAGTDMARPSGGRAGHGRASCGSAAERVAAVPGGQEVGAPGSPSTGRAAARASRCASRTTRSATPSPSTSPGPMTQS